MRAWTDGPRSRPLVPLVVSLLVVVTASCHPEVRSQRVPDLWVVQGGWVSQIRYAEPAIARQMLAAPSVTLGAVPGRHQEITAFAWPSYSWFSDEVFGRGDYAHSNSRGWLRPFTTVMYDPEGWSATPLAERRDPIAYIRRFAALAHSHGWEVIASPDTSLMNVPGARCGTQGSETSQDAFVRCDIAGQAARYSDVVEIQAQHEQEEPDAYREFVVRTAEQARSSNPRVAVIAGLTTGRAYTAAQMYAAWASVRDVVDGYYLSISGNNRVPTALALLRRIPWTDNRGVESHVAS